MILSSDMKCWTDKFGPWLTLFIGLHSIVLGLVIYFFTDFFYQQFFAAAVENIFFVRQSGIFLFLAGLFYLYPLIDLENLYNLLLLVIFSKFTAVYFLAANARFTLAPQMIYLAALFDGLMGCALIFVYLGCKKKVIRGAKPEMHHDQQFSMTDK